MILISSQSAGSISSIICKDENNLTTKILYLNGINKDFSNPNDTKEIKMVVDSIELNTREHIKGKSQVKYGFIPNRSANFISDVLKSYNQKINENHLAKPLLFSSVASLLAKKIALTIFENDNFKDINERIHKEITSHDKVAIVSHSQGNLYANDICQDIKKDKSIEPYLNDPYPFINIQIATPTSEVSCGSKYTSLKWDKVIDATYAGSLIPGSAIKAPLPHNVKHWVGFKNSEGLINSFLDHGLLDAYFGDPFVSYKIFSDIINETNSFPFHGFNEPIASYRVTGCPLTHHVKEDKFKNQILCKDAKEMDSQIKLQSNCSYNFIGTTKDSDAEVKFEADAPNYANMKVTYSPELGFKAEISPPEKTAPPFRSFFRIAGWLLGVSIALGGINHYKPLGRSHNDDES